MSTEPLAARLRQLRLQRWAEPVTQPTVGRLLGVSPPTISSYEKAESPAVPTADRLAAYATLFASHRSIEDGRLLAVAELTEAERAAREALLAELTALREQALSTDAAGDPDPWRFGDGAPVRILVGRQPEKPKTAGGRRWNYMALSAYADLDALVELYGHLREHNPGADVGFELVDRLEGDDLHAHLVLLGGLAYRHSDLRHLLDELPVRQVEDDDVVDGEVFEEVTTGHRWRPTFVGSADRKRVVEDVGLWARTVHPLDSDRTVTICTGVYTRGVYGAVRSLTDPKVRRANARYLRDRFAGASTCGVLMRVRGSEHAIGTPKLTAAEFRLVEFP